MLSPLYTATLKPQTHDQQMLANNCWPTFVGQLLDNSMAETVDSADDDDVAATVICLIARKRKRTYPKSVWVQLWIMQR